MNRRKQKPKYDWAKRAAQKITATPAKPAAPTIPGAVLAPQVQPALEMLAGSEEPTPIEANGIAPPPHHFSPHVREKDCLKEFDASVKSLGEEFSGKFVIELMLHRRAGRYRPVVRFYRFIEASKEESAEEKTAKEKQALVRFFEMVAMLSDKYLGTFSQVIRQASLEKDEGGNVVGAGEYEGQFLFTAY